jgi:hypothetical protein
VITVYISIGNSDDKLTQREWAKFVSLVRDVIRTNVLTTHGEWLSLSDARWQNACWCVEIEAERAPTMKQELAAMATAFRQDSIAWAVAETEFIGAAA